MTFLPDALSIESLPIVDLAGRSAMPDCPGVYFVLMPDNTVLYIGKARRLVERWKSTQHHRFAQFATMKGVRIAWITVSEEALLDDIEAACIEHFKPTMNATPVDKTTRYRLQKTITLDVKTWEALDRMVELGLYPSVSRAIDAAAKHLLRRYQKLGVLPPDPPDPGDDPD